MNAVRHLAAVLLVLLGVALALGNMFVQLAKQQRPVPGWWSRAATLSPTMLVASGQRALAVGDARAAEQAARRALALSPLDDEALELLVRALHAQQRWEEERRMLALSATMTRRNLPLQMMLASDAFAQERWAEGVRHADLLLRQRAYEEPVFADLRTAATFTAGRRAIVQRLTARPLWRASFLEDLHALQPTSDGDHFAILLALAKTSAPPIWPELTSFARRLINAGRLDFATQLRRAFAPLPQDGLLDGTFAQASDPAGVLGWALPNDISNTTGGGSGLELGSDGNGAIAEQVTFLPPGRYRLRWQTRGIHPGALSGLQWSLTCINADGGAGDTQQITPAVATTGPDDETTATQLLTVAGCAAQRLKIYYTRNVEDTPSPRLERASLVLLSS